MPLWDKINIFGWSSSKKPTPQPVQRDISITFTNGDRHETIHRSPSGTKLNTSSSVNPKRSNGLFDDDESSDGSNSINYGLKAGPSSRRNSNFSYTTREPLDPATWSNVTSPGFTSRIVHQASGHSPLKEFNDSISHSPFRRSPYKDLSLGEFPFVNFSKPKLSPTPHFSPLSNGFRTGASSSIYNRDRRKHARQGQVFVRITPIDPTDKVNVSINRKSPTSGPCPYPSARPGSEPYRNEGLGGIPQQELAMRFNRMWPHSPGSPMPSHSRPSSPTSPSNIMEALTAGRKRVREADPFYPPNATPPSMSPPTKISIGIGDTPARPPHQMSKRVKFYGEGHDRPMMVPYSGIGGDGEPLSSESILEQMNQTEKRFLPDSTSTPYSMQRKSPRTIGPGTDDQNTRKRRTQNNSITVDDDVRSGKAARFCTCNDCYAEAAGLSSPPGSPNKSFLSNSSDEKGTNTSDGKSKDTCEKGVSTDFDDGALFRELFRKADNGRKISEEDKLNGSRIMRSGKIVYTKEMYDRDKQKRIERYFRILKMKPPQFDTSDLGSVQQLTQGATVTDGSGVGANAVQSLGSPTQNPVKTTFATPSTASTGAAISTSFTSTASTFGATGPPPTSGSVPSSDGFTFSTSKDKDTNKSPAPPPAFGQGGVSTNNNNSASTVAADHQSALTAFGSTGGTGGFNSGTGASSSSPQSSAAPFAFGSSVTTTTTSSQQPAPVAASPGGFSFGEKAAAPAKAPPAVSPPGIFQLGQQATSPSAGKPFQFGQQGAKDVPVVPGSVSSAPSSGGFSFSTSKDTNKSLASPPALEQGGVSANNNVSTGTTDLQSSAPSAFGSTSGGFSFSALKDTNKSPALGQSDASANNNGSKGTADIQSAPNAFGSAASGTGGFSFGAAASPPQSSAAPFAFGSSVTTSSKPSASVASPGGFSFGQTAAAASTASAKGPPASNPPGIFQLGQQATSSSAGTPFQFGQQAAREAPVVPGSSASSSGGFSFSALKDTNKTPAFGQGSVNTNSNVSTGTGDLQTKTSTEASSGASQTSLPTQSSTFGSIFGGNGTGGQRLSGGVSTASSGFTFGKPNLTATTTTTSPSFPSVTTPTPGGIFGAGSQQQSGNLPALFEQHGTPSNTSSTTSPTGGFSFASVPNPLAGKKTTNNPTSPPFSTFGSQTTAASAPNAFGSTSGGFNFGAGASSPQSSAAPFAFGSSVTTSSQQPAPVVSSGGFSFGQTAAAPAIAPPAASPPGVFQFGNQAASPSAGTPFQFGQQSAQGVPGAFNFAAAAPAGGQPMFNMGSASTAPRRRDIRRRHR